MSDPTVIAFLTKLLCSHGGRLPRNLLSEFLELPTEQIDQILQDEPQKFPQVGDLVLARSALRICTKYLKNEQEEECDKLHLCRYYLQGKCWPYRRPPCRFSHDILSDHNRLVLKSNELSGLNDDEIKVLLFQNDNQLLPEVCVKYLHDTCDLGKECSRLHICGYFTRGECNRRACKRSHHLLEYCSDVLLVRNRMSEVSVQNFQMLCTVKHNEHLQSLKMEPEKKNPAGRRGRGRPINRNEEDSWDKSQNRSRGREQERAGSKCRGRSSSRLTSKSIESLGCSGDDDDDDNEVQKSLLDKKLEDWFKKDNDSLWNTAAKSSSILLRDPTPTVSTFYVRENYRSNIQSTLLLTSSKVSSQPEIPNDAPQPKPSITPVATAGLVNTPTSSIVPCRLANVPDEGPSVAVGDKSPTVVTPSTTPSMSCTRLSSLLDPLPKNSSVPQDKPVITPFPSSYSAQRTVTTIGTVTSPAVSPSTAPSASCTKSVASPTKVPSVPQEKPVMTPFPSSYSAQRTVTTIGTVTSPAVSPSTAPSASYTRSVAYPIKVPSVLEKQVQSNVRSQPITDNKPTSSHTSVPPKTPEPDIAPVICLSNVWKYCRLGKCCPHLHYYLPYCWQINKGTGWEDLSGMEEIEREYCNPKMESCRVPLIDFLTMRSGVHPVRRLSTVSSVEKPSEYVLTTEWLWYWKDEYGTWTQYGHSNVKQVSANILSSDFENVYLSDPTAVVNFSAGNQAYEINFREMKQKNLQYKTEKDVRRRPRFLSFEDVKLLKGSTKSAAAAQSPQKSGTSPLKTDIYPSTWQAGAMPEIGCQKVLVSNSSEFSEIVSSFTKTVSGYVVKRMWRLQNPSLWQVFQWQKEQMKKVNQGQDVKEVQLFHGTENAYVDAICNQNFDWRICGTHGTVYGQGSYFARDASYSHDYSTLTPSGTRMMFVARVLVGDYIVGNSQLKRPPQRPGSITRYYDSCVDDPFRPSIFVVFEKHQIYPEYLLEYQEEQKKSCAIC